jgi:hypothetical protein
MAALRLLTSHISLLVTARLGRGRSDSFWAFRLSRSWSEVTHSAATITVSGLRMMPGPRLKES